MSRWVTVIYRVVSAIGKHIIPQYTLPCRNITICINPPTDLRIIITAGYIVEPRLHIEVITAVAYGVNVSDGNAGVGFAVGIQNVYELAPRVIDILRYGLEVIIQDTGDVALKVLDQVIASRAVAAGIDDTIDRIVFVIQEF